MLKLNHLASSSTEEKNVSMKNNLLWHEHLIKRRNFSFYNKKLRKYLKQCQTDTNKND